MSLFQNAQWRVNYISITLVFQRRMTKLCTRWTPRNHLGMPHLEYPCPLWRPWAVFSSGLLATKGCQPNPLSQHRKFLGGFFTHLTLQQMVHLRLRSRMSNPVVMVFSLSLLHPQPLLLRSQPLRSILGLDQDVRSLRTFSLDPCPWLRVEVTNMSWVMHIWLGPGYFKCKF